MADLPVTAVLPQLRAALGGRGVAVLQAPPGAGKTTLVPLDLLRSGLFPGRIVMLEPRRLATRAAAERMASTLGEKPRATVGYRMRGEARVSSATRIEVVTEGILTRMIQSDAELPGVSCLVFDEFHERSLQADLGLALALEVRATLRPDLALLVMSATLDGGPVAALLGEAPLITTEGRSFPVETRWLARPRDPSLRFEAAMAGLIREALAESPGDALAFLPGEGEIRRTAALLADLPEVDIRPLFGAMDFAAQRAALAPGARRRLVLATSIAETSLTVPGVRVVVDGGLARRARFDPASGMSRLVTERVTRAEAEQRRGRAGRLAPGTCWRLWTKGEEGALAPFPPPEIAAADLAPLALEMALWGSARLPFLTPPPEAALAAARALLCDLGAIGDDGRITGHGRQLAGLPLHPRLAHMLALAGPQAATLAALVSGRDPLRGAGPELLDRLNAVERPPEGADRAALQPIRAEAARLARALPPGGGHALSPAAMAALAYPDRIGLKRPGGGARYLLSGGRGAAVAEGAGLGRARLIVATDLDGEAREALVRQGTALDEAELRELFGPRIRWCERAQWDRREGRVTARRLEMFGALVLDEQPWPGVPAEALAMAAFEGLRQTGLPWSPAARRLRARIALAGGEGWPAVDDAALLADPAWLAPFLGGRRSAADLRALDLVPPLLALIGAGRQAQLDRLVPSHFTTPLGRRIPIDYEGDHPAIEVRLQEMFGVTRHPVVGAQGLPLRVVLLSPAGRPVQVTLDLPGFWDSSWADVRKDMRGRYPRHPWPEDPRLAEPTLRARPRGG